MKIAGVPKRIEIICETNEERIAAKKIIAGDATIFWGDSDAVGGGALILSTADEVYEDRDEPIKAMINVYYASMQQDGAYVNADRDAEKAWKTAGTAFEVVGTGGGSSCYAFDTDSSAQKAADVLTRNGITCFTILTIVEQKEMDERHNPEQKGE